MDGDDDDYNDYEIDDGIRIDLPTPDAVIEQRMQAAEKARLEAQMDAEMHTTGCPMCGGTGKIESIVGVEQCPECHGTGQISV